MAFFDRRPSLKGGEQARGLICGWVKRMRDSIANLPLANCMVLTSVCTGQSNSPPDCLDLDGFESQSECEKTPDCENSQAFFGRG